MNKKQKKMLIRIVVCSIILFCLQLISVEQFQQLDAYTFRGAGVIFRFLCYFADYLINGSCHSGCFCPGDL